MGRGSGTPRFSYGPRQRYAYLPTIGFFVVVFAILLLDPALLWTHGVDARTRQIGLLLCGVLAVGFAVALVARWSEPFEIALEPGTLVATPLLGRTLRIPYAECERVVERPRTFLRSHVELEIRAAGRRRPLYIRGTIKDYARLTRLLRQRVPPAARADWKEVRDS